MKNVKNKAVKKHIYFDSSINKQKEVYIIIESSIGFNNEDFRNRIQDELNFLGMEWIELAESCYLNKSKLFNLMKGTENFESYEINVISKRLGF
jgi:predicted transcriptional regulator